MNQMRSTQKRRQWMHASHQIQTCTCVARANYDTLIQKKTFAFTKMSQFVQIAIHSFNLALSTRKLKDIWLWIVKHLCYINQVQWYLCLHVLITLTYIHPKHRPLLVCHCCQHCFPPHETPLVVFGIYFIKWFSLRFKVEMHLDFKRLWCKQQRSPFGNQFVPRLCFAYGSKWPASWANVNCKKVTTSL